VTKAIYYYSISHKIYPISFLCTSPLQTKHVMLIW